MSLMLPTRAHYAGICDGRLTLESGVPFSSSDQASKSTLYFTPVNGDGVSLYNGAGWTPYRFTERSLALSSELPYSLQDVFIYNNSGTLTLELTAWTAGATGPISGATNATPIVITDTSHGLTTDDVVAISGVGGNTAANGEHRVTVLTADTFSLQTLAGVNVAGNGAYTSGGTWYKSNYQGTRATALALQNGVYVKTGATTRRYLGTIRIGSTAGVTHDTVTKRFLDSHYHKWQKRLFKEGSGGQHQYDTASARYWNNDTANQVEMVAGFARETLVTAHASILGGTASTFNSAGGGFGANNTTMISSVEAPAGLTLSASAAGPHTARLGYSYATLLQRGTGAAATFYFAGRIGGFYDC